MCLSAPKIPPPPAQRQVMKEPEITTPGDTDLKRRRGFAALMRVGTPSLQPPSTTGNLGG